MPLLRTETRDFRPKKNRERLRMRANNNTRTAIKRGGGQLGRDGERRKLNRRDGRQDGRNARAGRVVV